MYLIAFLIFIGTCYSNASSNGSVTDFSTQILQYVKEESSGNTVISPIGLWTLLATIASGASGDSRAEVNRFLTLSNEENTMINEYKHLTETVLLPNTVNVNITSENFVFLDKGFDVFDSFEKVLSTDFHAYLMKLDFQNCEAAAASANDIVKKSGARNHDVFKPEDFVMSKMIVTNLITFKGLWLFPFNTSDTLVEPFYDGDGNQIGEVNMMYLEAPLAFSNMQSLQAHVIELPYGNDDKYSMLILLPYPKVHITVMYEKLKEITLQDILKRLESDMNEYDLQDVFLRLPRFKISNRLVFNKPLNKMGVNSIFNQTVANFDKITTDRIYISSIIQRAKIEVSEAGTEACADSIADIPNRIGSSYFKANRPFAYFIIEKPAKTVLFNGIYSEPIMF